MTVTKPVSDGKDKFKDNPEAQELFRKLDEALAACDAGRSRPAEEVFADIEKEFGFENI